MYELLGVMLCILFVLSLFNMNSDKCVALFSGLVLKVLVLISEINKMNIIQCSNFVLLKPRQCFYIL